MKKIIVLCAFLFSFSAGAQTVVPLTPRNTQQKAELFFGGKIHGLDINFCGLIIKQLNSSAIMKSFKPEREKIGSPFTAEPKTPVPPPSEPSPAAAETPVSPEPLPPTEFVPAPPSAEFSEPETPPKPKTPVPDTQGVLIPDLADDVIVIVNRERETRNIPPLKTTDEIRAAAETRAKEQTGQFSHTRPDGRAAFSVFGDKNIAFRGAGENIAMGQGTPRAVMEDWMSSPGHRENILNPKYTEVGVGCFRDVSGRYFWVQLFIY